MVAVFRYQARAQPHQSFKLSLGRVTSQVQVDTVLHDLRLWHQLEEDPRLPVRPFDQDVRVVLRISNPLTAQPGEFSLIVGCDLVTVEGSGPEPGD